MPKHVLVIDDSKTVRNLVAFILKKEGFKVSAAENGLEGLEKLYASSDISLILCDINMPIMDGLTLIKTVREQEVYKNIPIVILSTEGEEKDIQKGIHTGANMYMVKPAQPTDLINNVRLLIG